MDAVAPSTNPPERPGLMRRIVAFPITLIVIGGILLILTTALLSMLGQALGISGGEPAVLALSLLIAVAVILVWKGYKRWIEREPDREFALGGALPELAAGLAGGFALFCLMAGIVALLGGISFLGLRALAETQFWYWASIAIVSGVFEEALFRGLMFRQVERLGGSWIALAVTSAFFGLAHIFNPDASLFAALAISVEAGILLGAAYMLTRRLWLAVGLHASWNFTQGWVFSVPVSGGRQPIGLVETMRAGPDWLTGGGFGLEASAVAMVVATAAGLVLLGLAYRRGRFVAPPWRRGSHETVRVDVDRDTHPLGEA